MTRTRAPRLAAWAALRVGTSGYRCTATGAACSTRRAFPRREWLPRYARFFDTVELNTTFYRLPTAEAVDALARGRRRAASPSP